jgi:hypothetical protein
MCTPSRKLLSPQRKEGAAELFDRGLSKPELAPAADQQPRLGLQSTSLAPLLAVLLGVSERSEAERV